MGASSKIIHLRPAAADEVVFWQTVLLRHFVLFTLQLANPPGRGEGRAKEEPHPGTWQADPGTQQHPTNFIPFMQPYATYEAVLWKEK